MDDWQSTASALAMCALVFFEVCKWLEKRYRLSSRTVSVDTAVNVVLFLLMALMIFLEIRLGMLAILGLQALWCSVWFMVKPQVIRGDFLVLAIVWPLFFSALFTL